MIEMNEYMLSSTSNSTFFTAGINETAYIINGVSSGLSFLGGVYMILIYLTDVIMRTFPMKLVMAQVVVGMLYTCSNLMMYFEGSHLLCDIQGYLRTTFELSSVFWALTMTYITYDHVKTLKNRFIHKYWKMVFFIFFISSVPPTVALLSGYYGDNFYIRASGLVCGLYPEEYDLAIVYIPMMLCICLIAFYSIITRAKLIKLMEGQSDNDFGLIFWYPIILAILWLPNMIQSVLTVFGLNDNPVIFITHFTLSRLLGVVNAIIYGRFYRQVKARDAKHGRSYRNISMTESKTSSSEFRFNSVA